MAMRMRPPWTVVPGGPLARQSRLRADEVGVAPDHLARSRAQIVAGEREGDIGLEETDLVPAVEPRALEAEPVERPAADHAGERIGELDLAPRPLLAPPQMQHDLRLENVAPDDRERGRCLLGRR